MQKLHTAFRVGGLFLFKTFKLGLNNDSSSWKRGSTIAVARVRSISDDVDEMFARCFFVAVFWATLWIKILVEIFKILLEKVGILCLDSRFSSLVRKFS